MPKTTSINEDKRPSKDLGLWCKYAGPRFDAGRSTNMEIGLLMNRVLKYTENQDGFIEIPWHSKVLHVDNQREVVTLWALVDTASKDTKTRRFKCLITGSPVDPGAKYVGTVLLDGGDDVVHVFSTYNPQNSS